MQEGKLDWQQGGRWFLVGVAAVAAIASWSSNKNSTLSDDDALYLCEEALTLVSPDVEVVTLPDAAVSRTEDGIELIWRAEDGFRLTDASGELMGADVVCRVNDARAAVEHLEINGEIVLSRNRSAS